jgi:2-hydroxy-3-keto-5-methylthiopentenyl-1-phosphate phosphatase
MYRPIIRAIMSNLLGDEDAERIEIISNEADIRPDGHFSVKFRHPERQAVSISPFPSDLLFIILSVRLFIILSPFGHDKSRALRPYKQLPDATRPTIFFCGDGVSDMSVQLSFLISNIPILHPYTSFFFLLGLLLESPMFFSLK